MCPVPDYVLLHSVFELKAPREILIRHNKYDADHLTKKPHQEYKLLKVQKLDVKLCLNQIN